MLIKYSWLSGVAASSILDDIASLVCGNTNIATLSAACDKGNTVIAANTIATNWTLYDTSVSARVMRSQNATGTYKYAVLSNVGGRLGMLAAEGWNSSTGTINQAGSNSTGGQPQGTSAIAAPTTTAAGTLYIYATSHTLFIDGMFIGEFASTSMALDDTYPRHVLAPLNYNRPNGTVTYAATNVVGISRIKAAAATGDLTLATKEVRFKPYGDGAPTDAYLNSLRTPAEITFLQALPHYIRASIDGGASNHIVGKLYDGVHIQNSININLMDEILVDDVTYVMLATFSHTYAYTQNMFVPKG